MLFVTLWTVAHQASLSMRFSKQEYWMPSFRASSQPRDQTRISFVSCVDGQVLYH